MPSHVPPLTHAYYPFPLHFFSQASAYHYRPFLDCSRQPLPLCPRQKLRWPPSSHLSAKPTFPSSRRHHTHSNSSHLTAQPSLPPALPHLPSLPKPTRPSGPHCDCHPSLSPALHFCGRACPSLFPCTPLFPNLATFASLGPPTFHGPPHSGP